MSKGESKNDFETVFMVDDEQNRYIIVNKFKVYEFTTMFLYKEKQLCDVVFASIKMTSFKTEGSEGVGWVITLGNFQCRASYFLAHLSHRLRMS